MGRSMRRVASCCRLRPGGVGLPGAAYPGTNGQTADDTHRGAGPDDVTHRVAPRTSFLAIPTVYHKLAPTCQALTHSRLQLIANGWGRMVNYTGVCLGDNGDVYMDCLESSVRNAVPIVDLATSTDIAKCSGEACKAAARAVVAYQSMLGPITPMRLDALQIAQGTANAAPVLDQRTWTFQRSCDAVENILTRAEYVLKVLPDVIEGLRSSAPQLEASCIAPAREWPQENMAYAGIKDAVLECGATLSPA